MPSIFQPKSRIVAAIISLAGARAWLIFVRLIEAPLFLHYWGLNLWGEWLLLTAFVQYFQLTNLGIANAGQNEATMAAGAGKMRRALSALHTVHAALWTLSLVIAASAMVFLSYFQPFGALGLKEIDETTASIVSIAILCQLILKLQLSVPNAVLSAAKKYPLASLLTLGVSILEFLPVAIMLPLGFGPADLACALAAATFIGLLVFWTIALKRTPWMTFGWKFASLPMLGKLWRPTLGMGAFTLGTLLNVQGFRIAIGLILGPAMLSHLIVIRTFGQTIVQVGNIFAFSFGPELSAVHGSGDHDLFRKLARQSVQLTTWFTAPFVLVGIVAGQWFIDFWTQGKVHASIQLVLLILISSFIETIWRNTMHTTTNINRHTRISLAYVLVFGVLTVTLVALFSYHIGESGAVLALLTGQVLMAMAVIWQALPVIGEQHFGEWLRAILTPPIYVLTAITRRKPSK